MRRNVTRCLKRDTDNFASSKELDRRVARFARGGFSLDPSLFARTISSVLEALR